MLGIDDTYLSFAFFRALSAQAKRKFSVVSDRYSALNDLKSLLLTGTLDEFWDKWPENELKYTVHTSWIKYLKLQWLRDTQKWWCGYSIVSLMSRQ